MKVELFGTVLCPRCLYVSRLLQEELRSFPDLELERIEVSTNPVRSWQAGVRMLPTIRIGTDQLTGFLPGRDEIRIFITKHLSVSD